MMMMRRNKLLFKCFNRNLAFLVGISESHFRFSDVISGFFQTSEIKNRNVV